MGRWTSSVSQTFTNRCSQLTPVRIDYKHDALLSRAAHIGARRNVVQHDILWDQRWLGIADAPHPLVLVGNAISMLCRDKDVGSGFGDHARPSFEGWTMRRFFSLSVDDPGHDMRQLVRKL